MLRWVIVLLVTANAVFYAWSHGHLADLGFAPTEQREPERLKAQIRPEVMRLLNPPGSQPSEAEKAPDNTDADAHTGAETDPVAGAGEPAEQSLDAVEAELPPTACWVARGFTPAQAKELETRMIDLALPKGSWRLEEVNSGGRWVVYMGRYSGDALDRKKQELRELKVEFRTLNDAPLGPGLALGTFSSEEAAEQGLKNMTKKGVNSARVAQERGKVVTHTLRLAEVTEEERSAVEELGPSVLAGKQFQACGG